MRALNNKSVPASHVFENIPADRCVAKKYDAGILDSIYSGKSSIFSLINNQRLLYSFLYANEAAEPAIDIFPRIAKHSLEYKIGDVPVKLDEAKIRINMASELNGEVTIFEAADNLTDKFAVEQVFHPFLYYNLMSKQKGLAIKKVNCCYALKESYTDYTIVRMYLYDFSDIYQLSSLNLIKSAEYRLFHDNCTIH